MPAVDAAAAVRMTTELCAVLRRRGLPIAPPEVLDAVRALSIVGFEERNGTREVLEATLVKRAADRALFRRAFDEFFDGKGRRPRDLWERLAADGFSEAELATLAELLAAAPSPSVLGALLGVGGSGELTRLLRRPDVARMLEGLSNPLQVGFFAQRALELVGMGAAKQGLGALAVALRGALGERGEQLAEALSAVLEATRDEVREHVRQELARRTSQKQRDEKSLATTPFTALTDLELDEVRRAVRRLAEKLRGRARVRTKHALSGPIDMRRTLRGSWKTLSVPVLPVRRKKRRDRPRLLVLCDVSDSVRLAARFMLELVYALQELFSGTRSFVFVRKLAEVTQLFDREPVATALAHVLAGSAVSLADNSNYGAVFAEFSRTHARDVDRRTTLVIIGDGRNNYQPDEAWALSDLCRRARAVLWLNPERRATWGIGDSAMKRYAPLATRVLEVSCAAELEEAARSLIAM